MHPSATAALMLEKARKTYPVEAACGVAQHHRVGLRRVVSQALRARLVGVVGGWRERAGHGRAQKSVNGVHNSI